MLCLCKKYALKVLTFYLNKKLKNKKNNSQYIMLSPTINYLAASRSVDKTVTITYMHCV